MKRNMFLILSLCVLVIFVCSAFLCAKPQTDIGIICTAESGETVELFATENTFYLPAALDITKIRFSYDGDISYGTGVLKKGESLDITPFAAKDAQGADCYRLTLSFGGKTQEYTFPSSQPQSTYSMNTTFVAATATNAKRE